MKFENIRVFNFENAFRGMRNPKNSWHLSDSEFGAFDVNYIPEQLEALLKRQTTVWTDYILEKYPEDTTSNYEEIFEWLYHNGIRYPYHNTICEYNLIGPKDMKLAQTLIRGGSEHRKFLRQIFVTVDITAPLYW